ncbi:DNA-binding protein [Xylanimonas protaetiae]|uniref:DNA-binding protein n=1 Tax=Xylanimonas protaetiae TaxID=2509457 RepID=A0A4P6F7U0_9MICO|nr:DNA-binding protein [Xylanimonas protaetiae]QAY71794.1 DNA-binding protein [Xylanimonas protaetiae]
MGVKEIADLLLVSRQRASQISARRDFPEPVDTLAMGKVWLEDDVMAWAVATGRVVDDTVEEFDPRDR